MKINHKLIRGILKWGTFSIFAISVAIKLKAIIKYGGTTSIKDPNEDIHLEEDGPLKEAKSYDDADDADDDSDVEFHEVPMRSH